MPAACPTSDTDPGIPAEAFGAIAEYSTAALPQGEDCTGFRAFLSTGLPQYDSQSYEFFGRLVDDAGDVNSVALMSQGNTLIPGLELPLLTMEEAGLIFNRLEQGDGPIIGGIDGLADLGVPVSIDYQPWSIDVQHEVTGQPTQNITMRVVSGSIGAVGAVYELEVSVPTTASGASDAVPTTLFVRAKDTTGMIQWGYGPNGFFPLWMFDGSPLETPDGSIATTDQRGPITDAFGGDIGAYLAATGDPMTGQGSQYYSMPLVQVEEWSMQRGTETLAHGSDGLLFFDNLTETYNDSAVYLLKNGYSWTEFSVMLPDTLQGMLIAVTEQPEVGRLYYAMRGGAGSTQSANGTLAPTDNWPQGAITVTPDKSKSWTSPTSCYVYDLQYHVQLEASATRPAADLVFTATAQNQELDVLHRSAYEGLFDYSGTIDGEAVSGYAWGEIQGVAPKGDVKPPSC
ncbi:hypothetical protein GCM10009851_36270 [Herbiconiux moechotypicola]|uniref:Uncharacterized protein n=1 Tax=Herbiconiux moechotypicola TaxID=637393 RepID=A0ABN3E3M6_9MICO